jgi:hypothetical protein
LFDFKQQAPLLLEKEGKKERAIERERGREREREVATGSFSRKKPHVLL